MKHGLVIVLVCLIGFVLVTNAYGLYTKEYQNKPLVQEKVGSRDYNYLYDFYLSATPNVAGRPWVGDANAPITVIAYLSPESESSRFFLQEIYPMIESEYLGTGKARLIYKTYVTADDIGQKNDIFIKAAFLECVGQLKPAEYQAVWVKTLSTGAQQLGTLVDEFGFSQEEFRSCLDARSFPLLSENALEIENFGMLGIEPRFYIGLNGRDNTVVDGIPSLARFKRTLRNYQLIIGD
ncbi:MAG: thioredoxin domain-containing protein [Nanoarchaeota archaeon]